MTQTSGRPETFTFLGAKAAIGAYSRAESFFYLVIETEGNERCNAHVAHTTSHLLPLILTNPSQTTHTISSNDKSTIDQQQRRWRASGNICDARFDSRARERIRRSDEMAAAHTHGQRHDRIGTSPGNGELDTPPARRAADTPATLSQKMLSAVSGSIFTSLLGVYAPTATYTQTLLTTSQSHPSTSSAYDFKPNRVRPPPPASPPSSTSLPPSAPPPAAAKSSGYRTSPSSASRTPLHPLLPP